MPTFIMKTRSPARIPPAPLGASEFLAFIEDWGHPEWVVLAAEAPVDQVSRLLASAHWSKQVFHHVPIRPARKRDKEIAPLVAVAQCAGSPWTVAYLVLSLPISTPDLTSAQEDARMLSSKLKTRALAFLARTLRVRWPTGSTGTDRTSTRRSGTRHRRVQPTKPLPGWSSICPPCYPCAERRAAWLAVTDSSALRVESADLIKFGERAGRQGCESAP